MSDTNTAPTTAGTPAAQAPDANSAPATDEAIRWFATREECEANKPAEPGKKRVFGVTRPNGVTSWAWTNGYDSTLAAAARADGYTVTLAGKTKTWVVTADQVKARLAAFSDDELKALGLSRQPAPTPAAAPATDPTPAPTPAPKGKGKK
jgi:uncharacterized protein YjiS (DUF1127 family)